MTTSTTIAPDTPIAPEFLPLVAKRVSAARRAVAARSPHAFALTYLATAFERAPSRMHRELFQHLATLHEKRGTQMAIAAPRGHAKSTVVTFAYVLWCLLYKIEPFIVVVSATSDQATKLLDHVKRQLETNVLLRADFPELFDGTPMKPWTKRGIILPNGSMLAAYGSGQGLRGARNGKHRPTLIIADDLEDKDMVIEEEQRLKLADWFSSTLLKAGTPTTNVIVVGTILHHDALLANLLDPQKKGMVWKKFVYRAVERFADRSDLWDRWSHIFSGTEAFENVWDEPGASAFLEKHRAVMLKGAKVLWPEAYGYEDLMRMRLSEGESSFQAEFQNEPIDPASCIFAHAKLAFWDDRYPNAEALIRSFPGTGRFFGACDPSMGGNPSRGDYTAIIILYRPEDSKVNYVVAADLARRTPADTLNRIMEYARMYRIKWFGVEANQFQQLMVEDLQRRVRSEDLYMRVEPIKSRAVKQARILPLEVPISQGTLIFARQHQLLLEQLKTYPVGKHDDGPDALEMAMQMANKPSMTWEITEL